LRARALIDCAPFGAEKLETISKAFDATWAEIACIFGTDEIAAAREHLARALLSIAGEGGRSTDALREAAIRRMASDYTRMARCWRSSADSS